MQGEQRMSTARDLFNHWCVKRDRVPWHVGEHHHQKQSISSILGFLYKQSDTQRSLRNSIWIGNFIVNVVKETVIFMIKTYDIGVSN